MIIFLLVLIFLAILWPGLIRWTLAMLLVIGLFSIHANANEKVCGTSYIILDGIFSRGAYICNESWLQRPARRSVVALAKRCSKTLNEEDTKDLVKSEMEMFDTKTHDIGHDAACNMLDSQMIEIEKKL